MGEGGRGQCSANVVYGGASLYGVVDYYWGCLFGGVEEDFQAWLGLGGGIGYLALLGT